MLEHAGLRAATARRGAWITSSKAGRTVSRFRFDPPTPEEAREFLEWRRKNRMYQGELYQDALICERRLIPMTTEEERRAVREFNEDKRWGGV